MHSREPLLPVRRLAWFSLPFAAGCLISGLLLSQDIAPALILIPLVLLFLLEIAVCLLSYDWRIRPILALFGAVLGIGWTLGYTVVTGASAETVDGTAGSFTGSVLSQPTEYSYQDRYEVRLDGYGRAYLYLDSGSGLSIGDQFIAAGTAETASVRFQASGIRMIVSADEAEVTGTSNGPLFWPAKVSLLLQSKIEQLYTGDTAGLFRALLTGDKSGISTSLSTALSRCGLSHIVAVSGMHIGILSGICCLFIHNRKKKLLCLPVLTFFTLMVGSVSAWRALLMAALLLLAPVVHRESDSVTSLSFALLVILIQNPLSALTVSLQLSFASMMGLTLAGGRLHALSSTLREAVPSLPKPIRYVLCGILETILISVSASLFTLPLTALYFRQVSLISILANLSVTWALPILLVLGLLSVLGGLIFAPLGQLLAIPAGFLAGLFLLIIRGLGGLSFSAVSLSSIYLQIWFAFALIMAGIIAFMIMRRHRPIVPICAVICVLCVSLLLNRFEADRTALTVKILDVGQGQCILLLSQGYAAAIDCGGSSYDSAGDILADELQTLGISRLDLLLFTHTDSDHINGIEELFDRIEVDQVFLPAAEEAGSWESLLLSLCEEQGTDILYITEETSLSIGHASVTVYPPMDPADDNNSSLASLWTACGFSLLVTGDMDTAGERLLLAHEDLPDIDLLIVGHHGSRYASSELLLDAVQPETAVISVGSGNSYGFPTEETLTRLNEAGADIFRTDLNGTITVSVFSSDQE